MDRAWRGIRADGACSRDRTRASSLQGALMANARPCIDLNLPFKEHPRILYPRRAGSTQPVTDTTADADPLISIKPKPKPAQPS